MDLKFTGNSPRRLVPSISRTQFPTHLGHQRQAIRPLSPNLTYGSDRRGRHPAQRGISLKEAIGR
jgi:hypothetical protein